MPAKKKARVVILEGSWDKQHEASKIYPYFEAMSKTFPKDVEIDHRTFRNLDDIEHYTKALERNAGVLLYFACHGNDGELCPVKGVSIPMADVAAALGRAKPGAIHFVHFGACEMVTHGQRRASHELIMEKSGSVWVSGYTQAVDWLPSTCLDLLLAMQTFVPQFGIEDGRARRLLPSARQFFKNHDQMARSLGLSALVQGASKTRLFPSALHQPK